MSKEDTGKHRVQLYTKCVLGAGNNYQKRYNLCFWSDITASEDDLTSYVNIIMLPSSQYKESLWIKMQTNSLPFFWILKWLFDVLFSYFQIHILQDIFNFWGFHTNLLSSCWPLCALKNQKNKMTLILERRSVVSKALISSTPCFMSSWAASLSTPFPLSST